MSLQLLKGGDRYLLQEIASPHDEADWRVGDFPGHALIEHWQKGEVTLHAHFHISVALGKLKSGEYCALFDSPASEQSVCNEGSFRRGNNVKGGPGKANSRDRQCAMLVPVVNDLKLAKQSRFRALPSMIRLQPLNACSNTARDTGKAFEGDASEVLSLSYERELNILFSPRLWFRKCERDVVKRRAQVMRSISEQDSDPFREWLHRLQDDTPLLSVLIGPRGDFVELRVQESVTDLLSCIQVFTGPRHLRLCGT